MPIIWGAVWTALSGLIFSRAGSWVTAILVSLGIGLATQSTLVEPALDYIQSSIGGLPSDIAAWLGLLNIDKYFSIVGSAYVGGTVKKIILRKIGA